MALFVLGVHYHLGHFFHFLTCLDTCCWKDTFYYVLVKSGRNCPSLGNLIQKSNCVFFLFSQWGPNLINFFWRSYESRLINKMNNLQPLDVKQIKKSNGGGLLLFQDFSQYVYKRRDSYLPLDMEAKEDRRAKAICTFFTLSCLIHYYFNF